VAWMFVHCECGVLSGRSLWDGLITRPEESYRLWRVVVCAQETSNTRRLKPVTGL
jgi:tagatose-1,6-bisphosphate aldolase